MLARILADLRARVRKIEPQSPLDDRWQQLLREVTSGLRRAT